MYFLWCRPTIPRDPNATTPCRPALFGAGAHSPTGAAAVAVTRLAVAAGHCWSVARDDSCVGIARCRSARVGVVLGRQGVVSGQRFSVDLALYLWDDPRTAAHHLRFCRMVCVSEAIRMALMARVLVGDGALDCAGGRSDRERVAQGILRAATSSADLGIQRAVAVQTSPCRGHSGTWTVLSLWALHDGFRVCHRGGVLATVPETRSGNAGLWAGVRSAAQCNSDRPGGAFSE